MSPVIHPDGILRVPELPHTHIYGGKGAHAQDLISRGLLPPGTEEHEVHLVFLPISLIESAILEILGEGISQLQIVSFSGVMTKAPNGASSIHFLFGPGASNDLRVAVAKISQTYTPLVQAIIERAQSRGLRIIETSRTEHDRKMAVIQGLMHLWLVLVGSHSQSENIQNILLNPWKTPTQTIIDMIHANPFAEEVITEFFDSLPSCDNDLGLALGNIVETHLTEEDIRDFGTPNSARILSFIHLQNAGLRIGVKEIESVRTALNTRGHASLRESVERIRSEAC